MSVIEMRFCFCFWQLVCVVLILFSTNPQLTYSQEGPLDTSEPLVTLKPGNVRSFTPSSKDLEDNVVFLRPGYLGETTSVAEEKELKKEAEGVTEEVEEEKEVEEDIEEEDIEEEKEAEVEKETEVDIEEEKKAEGDIEEEKKAEGDIEEEKEAEGDIEEEKEAVEEKVVEVKEKEVEVKEEKEEEKEVIEPEKVESKSQPTENPNVKQPTDSQLIPGPEPESDDPASSLSEKEAELSTVIIEAPEVVTEAPEKATKAPKKPKRRPKKPKKGPKKPKRGPKKKKKAPKVITDAPKVVTEAPKIVTEAPKKIVTEAPKIVTEAPKTVTIQSKPKVKVEKKEEPCVDVFSVEEKRYQCKGYWKAGLTILALQINKLKKENQALFLKVIDANGQIKLAQELIAEHKINFNALKKKFTWPDKDNLVDTVKDCSDAFKKDHKKPGVYLIHPVGSPYKVHLLCVDGWTVIQRRFDGSEDFHRSFDEYLSGFGNFSGEFFVGLENLYRMTLSQDYTLRIDVKTSAGKWYFAAYDNFAVSDETDQFRLKLGNMTASNSDDVMEESRDKPFSTFDRDNDDWSSGNCAKHFRGGWWSGTCITNLNQMWCATGCLRWGSTRVVSSIMRIRPTSTVDPDDMTETPNPVGFSINE